MSIFPMLIRCRRLLAPALLAGVCCLAACTSPATTRTLLLPAPAFASTPNALDATYSDLGASSGKVFVLEPAHSRVRIYAFSTGEARQWGHNHVLTAPAFQGYVFLPLDGPGEARFDLEFRLDELRFDDPEERAALGGGFASSIAPALVESTREHMLGTFNFQADQFPLVRIHSLHIVGESPSFAARVAVELHGQQREFWLPLRVQGLPATLRVDGTLVLSQTDFGVKPYSVLGGLLAVQDQVVVEFSLQGRPR